MTQANAARAPRRWVWRFIVVLILASGAAGFWALLKFKPRPAVQAPVRQLPLVQAEAVRLLSGSLPVTGHGLLRPRMEVVLGAEVSGRVIQIHPGLVSGGSFRANELLVALDPEPFRAALAQASADLASAQAALRLAEQLVQRTEDLIAKGFLSRQTLDERIAARDQARAARLRAEAIERQRALDLQRTQLRAPFDGRVLSKKLDVGDTVQPGKELARLFSAKDLEVAVSLTDRDMALIQDPWQKNRPDSQGAAAQVIVTHGAAQYRWDARVDRIEAAVDAATRTFNVVVRVNDPLTRGRPIAAEKAGSAQPQGPAEQHSGPPLLVGMFARVEITGRDQGRYARIPRAALRDESTIWLLNAQDRLSIRKVQVLSEQDESVAISAEGLSAESRVVVSDLAVVTDGLEVRVIGTQ